MMEIIICIISKMEKVMSAVVQLTMTRFAPKTHIHTT
ncbi:hypothetical protein LA5095_00335 [Roseibium album]|uniref:Uncharacterized protein n=1 Tax=Roseibium album TaxID=311410 RepID=A0A0M6ZRA8_9HYPH|nr:hypothetical protein LA5094_03633 [Roseibium album]CTQ64782.1 hypothetical protein LA5095_00335 [Roseibium album]CTQ72972.1 hypothetical protein LA5096_03475 [Roseibium album]